MVNLIGKRGPQDDLETKPFLRKHKGKSKETTEGFADSLQREEFAVRKKTLYFDNFARQAKISDIINFFKNVEGVVRVQLVMSRGTNHMGRGFVEFASSDEARKALKNKNGEYFCDCKILLDVDSKGAVNFPPKLCVDHKFGYKDYLRQENLLVEEGETMEGLVEDVTSGETTLFVSNLSPQSKLPDIINFFNYCGRLVSVRLIVNHEGKHVGYAFVEFSSAKAAKRLLRNRNGKYLHDHKIFLALATRTKDNLAEMLWYEDCLREEDLPLEEDEAPPYFVEEVDVRNKTLLVGNFSPQTEVSHIINFFKDVGEVVHVRLFVDLQGKHVGFGFVEFASTTESKKALDHKYRELHGRKIFLDLAKNIPDPPRLEYLEYLRRESLPIEDETVKRIFEEVSRRKKNLFIRNLSVRAKKSDIINFFKDVGDVVYVHLSEVPQDIDVRYGLVEFASSTGAKKALDQKNGQYLLGHKIFLNVDKRDEYPLRPMCCIDHKVWYEDYLRQEGLLIEDDDDETIEGLVEEVAGRKKTLFVTKLARRTKISDIIRFFKDVAEVFRVQLIVDHIGEHVGCGFVEFASVIEAKKALQKKNGMRLCGSYISLDVAKIAPYPLLPKYSRAEKLWSTVESCLMKEDDLDTKPNLAVQKEKVMDIFCGKKSTLSDDD